MFLNLFWSKFSVENDFPGLVFKFEVSATSLRTKARRCCRVHQNALLTDLDTKFKKHWKINGRKCLRWRSLPTRKIPSRVVISVQFPSESFKTFSCAKGNSQKLFPALIWCCFSSFFFIVCKRKWYVWEISCLFHG